MWIKLRADKATPFDLGISSVQLNVTETLLTPKAGYMVVDSEKIKVAALVGFRYWHLGQNLSFQPSGLLSNISQSADWVDALGGPRSKCRQMRVFLTTILIDMLGNCKGFPV